MASLGTAVIQTDDDVYGSNFVQVVIPAFNGTAVIQTEDDVYGHNYLSRVLPQALGVATNIENDNRFKVNRVNPTG